VDLLEHRKQRLKLNRVSVHADILKERHDRGPLGEFSPWAPFQDADLFLFLRSVAEREEFLLFDTWRPWSAALLQRCPSYLLEAIQREKAEQLIEPLGVEDVAALRNRVRVAVEKLYKVFSYRNPFYHPFAGFNPDHIGTK
jgi:hypothetical protein